MDKKVIIIPPTQAVGSTLDSNNKQVKKRVSAYCRVSTNSEEQLESLNNQIEEFTKRITENPNYELVEIYYDRGITGTSSKKREGFNRMIDDARHGKIDLILCKSLSRLGRNTILILSTIRELKQLGVEVYFDKEHMSTFDEKTEMMLTMMSSIAQDTSRDISSNITWILRSKMQSGQPMVNCNRFLGYDKSEDGKQLIINIEESKIVQEIFDLYDSGEGCLRIAQILQQKGYKTGAGKDVWYTSTVLDILRNEKYIGNLLLQKTYTVDYLGHIRKENKGDRPMYRVNDAHEAIISKEQWDRVQAKLANSKALSIGNNPDMTKYNSRYPLSGMLTCASCGNTYKRRTFNSKTSKTIGYQCNTYIKKNEYEEECHNKSVSENLAHKACCDVINKIFIGKSKAFAKLTTTIKSTLSSNRLDSEIVKMNNLKDKLNEKIDEITKEKIYASSPETKKELDERREKLIHQFNNIDEQISELTKRKSEYSENTERMNKMLSLLNTKQITTEILNNEMVSSFFSKIFVTGKNELVFVINATKTLSSGEMIERRQSIINQKPLYENSITERNPIKKATIKYKVVLV